MSAAWGPPHGLSTGPAIHARFGAFRRQGDRWDRHGSESYFVIGEGILAESVGGRNRTLARTAEAQAPPFRFSRMGPNGGQRQLSDSARRRLGDAMTSGGGGSSQIPASFTYLGRRSGSTSCAKPS